MASQSKLRGANPAVDRLLEALSPALASELDRIIIEVRQALEADFDLRLQQALRETEAAAQSHLERTVAETQEKVRKQVSEELRARFDEELQARLNQLRTQLEEAFKAKAAQWEAERGRIQAELEQKRLLLSFPRQAMEASTQGEILSRFLKVAEKFAAGVAIYVNKADGLALWKSRGDGEIFPPITSAETVDSEFYFAPVVIRYRTVAAISARPPYDREGLDWLVDVLAKAIEHFGLRLRFPQSSPPLLVEEQAEPAAAAATDAADQERKLHSDARRYARSLVSEIKFSNEQQVKEGREKSDLYQRLQKEIESGREAYNDRIPPSVSAQRDYFHEELVRILAENDPSRLGETSPGHPSS